MIPDTLQHVSVAAQATGDAQQLPHNVWELLGLLIIFARGFFTDRVQNAALARIEENSMQARVHAESANRKAWREANPGYATPNPDVLVTVHGREIPKAPAHVSGLAHEKPTKRGRE